jgi:branched-chain amino acid transport system substrate-binding protein
MRKGFLVGSVAFLLFLGLSFGDIRAADKQPYKVGLVVELSGGAAPGGAEVRDGVLLEVERINASGGINGHPIELVIGDNGSEATKGVTAATKLTKQDKVLALVGPMAGWVEGPVRAVAEREKTPNLILAPPTPDDRKKGYKWSWTLAQNEYVVADAQIDIMKDKGYRKVVAIGDTEARCQEHMRILKGKAAPLGIEIIIMTETFDPSMDFDMTAQVTKVKDLAAKENPQALLLMTGIFQGIPFMKNMKQLGLSLPVIGAHNWGIPAALGMAGDELEGVVFPAGKVLGAESLPDSDPQKAILLDYKNRFRAKFKYDVGQFGAHSYDGVQLFVRATKAAGADKTKIREEMDKIRSYVGATGVYSFGPKDHEGLTKQSLAIYEIKGKKFVYVKSVK